MKKKVLILLIILLTIFALYVVYNGIKRNNLVKIDKKEPISFIVGEEKKKFDESEVKDKDLYAKNIVTNLLTTYNYELILDNDSIYGTVYIRNGNLYIQNEETKSINMISNSSIKTLLIKESNTNMLSLYALSEDGKIYYFILYGLDITKYKFYEIETDVFATNFTNLTFKTLDGINMTNLIVLANDGNLYDMNTGIRYSDNILSLNEQYYVYDDNTIANSYGNMIKNNGEYFKIKYYIQTPGDDKPFVNVNSIIITDNNELLYAEDNNNLIYLYKSRINNIEYDKTNKIVKITFDDLSNMSFVGQCGDRYSL